jgi:hypothetical protein
MTTGCPGTPAAAALDRNHAVLASSISGALSTAVPSCR